MCEVCVKDTFYSAKVVKPIPVHSFSSSIDDPLPSQNSCAALFTKRIPLATNRIVHLDPSIIFNPQIQHTQIS